MKNFEILPSPVGLCRAKRLSIVLREVFLGKSEACAIEKGVRRTEGVILDDRRAGCQEGFSEVRKLRGQEGKLVNKTSPRPIGERTEFKKLTFPSPTAFFSRRGSGCMLSMSITTTGEVRERGKKAAFTLAEVLITITVIGVVAALTLPPLIHGYKKRVTETRLKQAYSILYQAKERAVADYGEMSGWEFGSTGLVPQSTPGFASQYLTSFFNSYISPHAKIIKNYGYTHNKNINHKIYFPSGGEWSWNTINAYIFVLQNGIIINLYLNTTITCDEYNEDGSCKVSSIKFTDIYATVDVNGFAKPNKFNSDVFQMVYDYKNNKIYYYGTNDSLNNAKNGCYNGKEQQLWKCGGFIQKNNWIIPDDYPYKL